MKELCDDQTLIASLSNFGSDTKNALVSGLDLAVVRGTLIKTSENGKDTVYLLNTPSNRSVADNMMPAPENDSALPVLDNSSDRALASLSKLYEDNIGSITSLIAEELKETSQRYKDHPDWIEAAFREAVKVNVRSLKYVQRILERWEVEGPDYGEVGRDSRSNSNTKQTLSGRYGHLFRR